MLRLVFDGLDRMGEYFVDIGGVTRCVDSLCRYNNEGAGGHVTVRDPIKTDCFWINPFAKSFRYIRPEDLCLVDEEGIVQPEGNMHAIVRDSAMHYACKAANDLAEPGRLFYPPGCSPSPSGRYLRCALPFHTDEGFLCSGLQA